MIRLFAAVALVLGASAFAQPRTPQQECQLKCGEAMAACMGPCTGPNPSQADRPDERTKTMACVKKCSEVQAPCLKSCESKK